ncbi:MAG: phosphotransferase family protein [Alphaproteobacteria bacterium]|nr:phosphotransferase family protein [Alphaproteobacteria bacterium]
MTTTDNANRQEMFSGTKDVADALRFDESRLAAYLADTVEGFKGPLTVRQFKGGQSNPTYQLVTPSKKYVLRRKPPGKLLPSAHAVDREHRVISALHKVGYPVPRPYVLCEDEGITGTMFYVMDMVEGRVLWEPTLPGMSPKERAGIYDAMNDTISRLHTIDYAAIGLGDFGKPGNYFARQIGRWSKQYKLAETEVIPEMDKLIAWLPENIPHDETSSIVHGDFRIDNMIFHPTEPRVIAVLDWELSTIGHPLADFTYHLMQWYSPAPDGSGKAFRELDLGALGIPTAEAYVDAYCRRTGRIGLPQLDFYFAYNLFRSAGILQGIVKRVLDGTAASANAYDSADHTRQIAVRAWAFAKAAGARD